MPAQDPVSLDSFVYFTHGQFGASKWGTNTKRCTDRLHPKCPSGVFKANFGLAPGCCAESGLLMFLGVSVEYLR
jgi:hypothetical protein